MSGDVIRTGGCFCGALRFEARGEPTNVRICHCRFCQRSMGSPFFARALYDAAQVRLTGQPERFHSSPDLARLFCAACGTRIGAARPSAGRISLALALFDEPDALQPDCHFFMAFKCGWDEPGDGLPQYPEWPPG